MTKPGFGLTRFLRETNRIFLSISSSYIALHICQLTRLRISNKPSEPIIRFRTRIAPSTSPSRTITVFAIKRFNIRLRFRQIKWKQTNY
ncbi:hypothetical protein DERP_009353 [Dermatophagoides pteronyssinus]|uniref:Uncharacterized protein n=1 Tax=Dermatophagoides pteronyssinus TaxID=6956 RepID=A0ABQ8ITM8_DERPT|nr:hypothetical protein DERP_009353 [Dermatophagoides pteronyssinus]